MDSLTKKFTVGTYGILGSLIFAGALPTFAQESTSVLPRHIYRVRAVGIFGGISHSFNNDGDRVELLNKLNSTISSKQQAEAAAATKPELKSLYDKLEAVESGLGDQLFQTNLVSEGNLSFQQYIAAAEWGLTNNLTLGVIVPYAHIRITPKSGFVVSSQAKAIAKKLDGMGPVMQPLADGVRTFDANTPTSNVYDASVFTNNGYSVPSTTDSTGLGDIEVGAQWRLYNSDSSSFALKSGFRLPTASHQADYRNLMDKPTGDKQLDYAFQTIANINPIRSLTFGLSAKYTLQFADKEFMPVATVGQSGLTNLNNEGNWDTVNRNLGDQFEGEVNTVLSMAGDAMTASVAYQYSLKGKDRFSGNKGLDYDSLSVNSNTMSHRYNLGLTFTTIPAFKRKKFAIPLEIALAYNAAFKAINSTDSAYTRFDLKVFF